MTMRRIVLGFIGLLVLPLLLRAAEVSKTWDPVLSAMGVKDTTLPAGQYVALIKKLDAFPAMAVKIRQASTKPITLAEWKQILRGLGILPKPQMTDAEWISILAKAGVDISRGISPSLAQAQPAARPVPSQPVATPPTPPAVFTATTPVVNTTPVVRLSSAAPVAAPISVPVVQASTVPMAAPAVLVSSPVAPAVASTVTVIVPVLTVSTAAVPSAVVMATAPSPAMVLLSSPTLVAGATSPSVVQSTASDIAASTATVPAAAASSNLTLELRGLDIHEVLKTIARQGSLNLITNANVRGSVSVSLKNVDLWDALRIILEANDLAYAYDGKILRVMTAADYEKLYGSRFDDKTVIKTVSLKNVKASAMGKYLETLKSRLGKILVYDYNNTLILVDTPESIQRMEDLSHQLDSQLSMKVYSLNYTKVDELLPKIQSLVTKDIGTVEVDKRTNRMIVMDFPEHFASIDRIVTAFDRKHRAVLIEAKILQITLNNTHQMGVNWQYIFSSIGRNNVGGSMQSAFNFAPLPVTGGALAAGGFAATLGSLAENNYTALIQALQTVGKTNLLSAPRITAINNETASILVGTREAYVTTTVTTPGGGSPSTTAEQINFVDVGVKLHVTPVIGEDNYVTIKIKPEVSSVDRTLTTSQGNIVPIVRTSQSETSVVAKDGETVILAGLIEDNKTKSTTGIPFLSRIPILGIPFRSSSVKIAKTDITVFITTRIMPDDLTGEQGPDHFSKLPELH